MMTRALAAAVVALLLPVVVLAGAFGHRYSHGAVIVAPPAVWFEDPLHPDVYVELYRHKTFANVTVSSKNLALRLVNRSGLALDLTNPEVAQENFVEVVETGCRYSYTTDGVGILVVGNPQLDGYSGCLLAYKEPVEATNMAVSFIMRTDDTGTNYGIRGVLFANATTWYYYMAGLKNNRTGWFFGVYKYVGRVIREPGGPVVPPLRDVRLAYDVMGRWLGVTIQYIDLGDGGVLIKAWLYDITSGRLLARLEVVDAAPIRGLNTFGVGVYQVINRPSAVFRMVSFTRVLYVLIVKGLIHCCDVYVYDSSGNVVGSAHVDETGVAMIWLENSVLVNATVRVRCGASEYEVPARILLGGDVYELYVWFEGPILRVHADSQFAGWVRIESAECAAPAYRIQVGLANQTHVSDVKAEVIWVHGETIVLTPETSVMLLMPADAGWAGNITLRAELYILSQCTLRLMLYYSHPHRVREVYGGLEARVTVRSS